MDPDRSREILQSALQAAGKELLKYFSNKNIARKKESISSVVTDADFASEKVIFEILETTPCPCNIISEESGFKNRGAAYTWVVDPLDGTSNFAAGLPWFGVIITLFKDNKPIQGGMYLPVENQLFFAEYGEGAFKNDIRISDTDSSVLEEQLIAYSFDYSTDQDKASREMELLLRLSAKVRNIRSTNSLVDFCLVADGSLGGAINQTTRIWDIAASYLLFREMGCVVSDISGKEIDFDLSKKALHQNYTIVASSSKLHRDLIQIIHSKP